MLFEIWDIKLVKILKQKWNLLLIILYLILKKIAGRFNHNSHEQSDDIVNTIF